MLFDARISLLVPKAVTILSYEILAQAEADYDNIGMVARCILIGVFGSVWNPRV